MMFSTRMRADSVLPCCGGNYALVWGCCGRMVQGGVGVVGGGGGGDGDVDGGDER